MMFEQKDLAMKFYGRSASYTENSNNRGPKGSTQAALEEQQRWPVWDTQ